MRPKMMVGIICLVSASAFAACQPAQSVDAAATDAQALRLEPQRLRIGRRRVYRLSRLTCRKR